MTFPEDELGLRPPPRSTARGSPTPTKLPSDKQDRENREARARSDAEREKQKRLAAIRRKRHLARRLAEEARRKADRARRDAKHKAEQLRAAIEHQERKDREAQRLAEKQRAKEIREARGAMFVKRELAEAVADLKTREAKAATATKRQEPFARRNVERAQKKIAKLATELSLERAGLDAEALAAVRKQRSGEDAARLRRKLREAKANLETSRAKLEDAPVRQVGSAQRKVTKDQRKVARYAAELALTQAGLSLKELEAERKAIGREQQRQAEARIGTAQEAKAQRDAARKALKERQTARLDINLVRRDLARAKSDLAEVKRVATEPPAGTLAGKQVDSQAKRNTDVRDARKKVAQLVTKLAISEAALGKKDEDEEIRLAEAQLKGAVAVPTWVERLGEGGQSRRKGFRILAKDLQAIGSGLKETGLDLVPFWGTKRIAQRELKDFGAKSNMQKGIATGNMFLTGLGDVAIVFGLGKAATIGFRTVRGKPGTIEARIAVPADEVAKVIGDLAKPPKRITVQSGTVSPAELRALAQQAKGLKLAEEAWTILGRPTPEGIATIVRADNAINKLVKTRPLLDITPSEALTIDIGAFVAATKRLGVRAIDLEMLLQPKVTKAEIRTMAQLMKLDEASVRQWLKQRPDTLKEAKVHIKAFEKAMHNAGIELRVTTPTLPKGKPKISDVVSEIEVTGGRNPSVSISSDTPVVTIGPQGGGRSATATTSTAKATQAKVPRVFEDAFRPRGRVVGVQSGPKPFTLVGGAMADIEADASVDAPAPTAKPPATETAIGIIGNPFEVVGAATPTTKEKEVEIGITGNPWVLEGTAAPTVADPGVEPTTEPAKKPAREPAEDPIEIPVVIPPIFEPEPDPTEVPTEPEEDPAEEEPVEDEVPDPDKEPKPEPKEPEPKPEPKEPEPKPEPKEPEPKPEPKEPEPVVEAEVEKEPAKIPEKEKRKVPVTIPKTTAKVVVKETPRPRETPRVEPEPQPTPDIPGGRTRIATGRLTKAITRTNLPRQQDDDARIIQFTLPRGTFIETLGWRQGKVFVYKNILTGKEAYSAKPLFNMVPTKRGTTPFDSITVISTTRSKPQHRIVEMGLFVATVTRKGRISYKRKAVGLRDRSFSGGRM